MFALCTRLMDPVTPVKAFDAAHTVPEELRCPRCWDRAFPELPASRAEPLATP